MSSKVLLLKARGINRQLESECEKKEENETAMRYDGRCLKNILFMLLLLLLQNCAWRTFVGKYTPHRLMVKRK